MKKIMAVRPQILTICINQMCFVQDFLYISKHMRQQFALYFLDVCYMRWNTKTILYPALLNSTSTELMKKKNA